MNFRNSDIDSFMMPGSSNQAYNNPSFGGGEKYGLVPPPRNPYVSNSYGQMTVPYSSYGYDRLPYMRGYSNTSNPYMNFTPDNMYSGLWDSPLMQGAAASSTEAFQGIESVIRTLSSVTTMLESTFHAVYSSFHSVLAVTQQFSRLKSHIGQIFSALAIMRTLRWMLHKLLYILGLRASVSSNEEVWKAAAGTSDLSAVRNAAKSHLPAYLFFAIMYVGPYLIWKMVNALLKKTNVLSNWKEPTGEHTTAVGLLPYKASKPDEISCRKGQEFIVAPKHLQIDKNWCLLYNGKSTGLVPYNYINIGQKSTTDSRGAQMVNTGTATNPTTKPSQYGRNHSIQNASMPGTVRNNSFYQQTPLLIPNPAMFQNPSLIQNNRMPYGPSYYPHQLQSNGNSQSRFPGPCNYYPLGTYTNPGNYISNTSVNIQSTNQPENAQFIGAHKKGVSSTGLRRETSDATSSTIYNLNPQIPGADTPDFRKVETILGTDGKTLHTDTSTCSNTPDTEGKD